MTSRGPGRLERPGPRAGGSLRRTERTTRDPLPTLPARGREIEILLGGEGGRFGGDVDDPVAAELTSNLADQVQLEPLRDSRGKSADDDRGVVRPPAQFGRD